MSAHRVLHDLFNAPYVATDPGDTNTIAIDRNFLCMPLTASASSETRKIAHPTKAGLIVTIMLQTAGGGTITLTDASSGTFDGSATSITFATICDWVMLQSIKLTSTTYRWQVVQSLGVGGITSNLSGAASVTNLAASGAVNAVNVTASGKVAAVNAALSGVLNTANITATGSVNTVNVIASGAVNAVNATLSGSVVATANVNAAAVTTTNATFTTSSLGNATMGQRQLTVTAVAAAGSDQTNAGALVYGVNLVNSADNTKAVMLPATVVNGVVDVIQTVNAKTLPIFGQVNSSINGLAANVAFTTGTANTGALAGLATYTAVRFICTAANTWWSMARN